RITEYANDELDDLWNYYKEFVFYNHFTFGRINRLKNDVRKTVVLVDTDSNMLNLNPWMQFLYKYIISSSEKLMRRDPDQLRFIGINTMCYILTNMITEVLNKYTKTANIPKEYRDRINMKNEYLFSRLILSPKKKRYISSIR
ncbi:family B DNA polymerase, partial [Brevibacillus sp. MCWH]|uniref:family B DNA polymerase n=1 Tax=Brevibacillus sp. MCWH TaxID=2508871 RepID=UPI001C0EFFE1